MASPCSMPASQVQPFPWLMFLFLAAMLFLPHDLYFSKKGIEAFNLSERELVTRAANTRSAVASCFCLWAFSL